MATNPPPADLGSAQGVFDAESGGFRIRREDERTAAGAGVDHDKFILCAAIGVRSACNCPSLRLHSQPRLLHRPSVRNLAFQSSWLTI